VSHSFRPSFFKRSISSYQRDYENADTAFIQRRLQPYYVAQHPFFVSARGAKVLGAARALARLGFISVALGAFAVAHAQIPQNCSVVDNVGVEPGKPFTAQRVIHRTLFSNLGTQSRQDVIESIARDTVGRIRIEEQVVPKQPFEDRTAILTTWDGREIITKDSELNRSIQIVDCPDRKIVTIDPARQMAWVESTAPDSFPDHPYSTFFSAPTNSSSPSLTVEDLGDREIDGFLSHGFRTTKLGEEGDGEWSGKPVKFVEVWVSDDLATTLIEVDTYPRTKTDDSSALTNIKLEEPDAVLFEIPAGYTINPTGQEKDFKLTYPNK
jgi:hypothetical protein